MEKVYDKLIKIDGGLVLDVASGTGDFLNLIKKFNCFEKVIIADVDEHSLEIALERFPEMLLEKRTKCREFNRIS